MDKAYWIDYSLRWASVLLSLAFVSPLLISAYVILKNDGEINVRSKG